MTTKILMAAGMLATTLVLPASALAATYNYVDTNGHLQTVDADTTSDAMNHAVNAAPGNTMTLDATTLGREIYQYVSGLGVIKVIVAASADAAILNATDIAPHSGVINVDTAGNPIPTNMTVTDTGV